MRIFVCGPIGYGRIDDIKNVQLLLRRRGYDVLDQLEYDYSHVDDFRDKPELVREIIRRDLELCEKADLIVFVVKEPSFGAMAEAMISSIKGKTVIAFCPDRVKSPWPIYFSDVITRNEEELLKALEKMKQKKKIRTIPNIYGEHEAEFVYDDFTCICPVTGKRDYAVIRIRYRPGDRLLEYESLDNYFKEFRDLQIHHEAVVKRVFYDLLEELKPKKLEVIAEFEERSGVRTLIRYGFP